MPNTESVPPPRWADLIIGGVTIALLGGLSALPLVAPGPAPQAETAAGEFSTDRAMEHIGNIAKEPHPMGSAANARVRTYLEQELAALGLKPETQPVNVPDYYGDAASVEAVNLLARIPGLDSTKAVALVAHYDSAPNTFGANDDAAGVAVLLEAARVLLIGPGVRNDVILLFTDGEEPTPRYGSTAFVAQHPWAAGVGFVVNFEAAGGSGPSFVAEMNGAERWLVDGLAESTTHPVAFSYLTETVELLGGIGTDFDPFAANDVAGFHLAYLRGTPIYHTMDDNIDHVALGSVHQHGSSAVALSRHFGDLDLNAPRVDEELVFFSLGRSLIVRYPAGWSVPLAILATVVFAGAVAVRFRRNAGIFKWLFVGFAVVLAGLVAAVLASTMVWSLFSRVRQTPGVAESYAYLVGLLSLASAVGGLVWRAAKGKWSDLDAAASVLGVWVVVGIAASVWVPGAGYMFVWPALAGSIALMWIPASRTARLPRLMLVAGPALLLVTPAVDTFFQLALPRPGNPDSEVVEAVAVVVFLAALVVALIATKDQSWSERGVV